MRDAGESGFAWIFLLECTGEESAGQVRHERPTIDPANWLRVFAARLLDLQDAL